MKRYFQRYFLWGAIALVVAIATPKNCFARTMPDKIDGFFDYQGKTYAKAGGTICEFIGRGHRDFFIRTKFAMPLRITDISAYDNIGNCPIPRAMFHFERASYLSLGDGNFCSLNSPEMRMKYWKLDPDPVSVIISTNPREFMNYQGVCSL